MSRRILLPLTALVLFLMTQTGCLMYPIRGEIQSHETASIDGLKKLAVETRNGEIGVRCDPAAKEVAIHVNRSARGLTEQDARAFAERIEIHVDKGASETGVL